MIDPIVIAFVALLFTPVFTIALVEILNRRSRRNKTNNTYRPSEVNESLLCQGPHSWTEVPGINEEGEYTQIQACESCGFLPGRNLMVKTEMIAKVKEEVKAVALENQFIDEFSKLEEEQLKEMFSEEFKSGLDFKKIFEVYNRGQLMRERFILYRIARLQQLQKESK